MNDLKKTFEEIQELQNEIARIDKYKYISIGIAIGLIIATIIFVLFLTT